MATGKRNNETGYDEEDVYAGCEGKDRQRRVVRTNAQEARRNGVRGMLNEHQEGGKSSQTLQVVQPRFGRHAAALPHLPLARGAEKHSLTCLARFCHIPRTGCWGERDPFAKPVNLRRFAAEALRSH